MKKTLSALTALLGPLAVIVVLGRVAHLIERYTGVSFNPYPRIIWCLASGVFIALYLAVLLVLCPRHTGPALVPCAVLGAVAAFALCVLDVCSFSVLTDLLPFRFVLPIRLEDLTVLRLTGVTVTGNILCAIRASHVRNETGRRLNE